MKITMPSLLVGNGTTEEGILTCLARSSLQTHRIDDHAFGMIDVQKLEDLLNQMSVSHE
jgi:hypothetical protein